MERNFSGGAVVGFAISSALSWAIYDSFGIAWMLYVTMCLLCITTYYAIGHIVEDTVYIYTMIYNARLEKWRKEITSTDKDLLLGESLTRMSSEALRVFGMLASTPFDPNDPSNDILPGFAILTRKFAIAYLASCGPHDMTPIRTFPEGTRDRQREQAIELVNWLVTEGYANHWGGNRPASWKSPDSPQKARDALNLSPAPPLSGAEVA